MSPLASVRAVCFDWGGTLMSEQGPQDRPMADWPHVHALPGAAQCLAALAGRFPLAIATNATVSGQQDIRRALARVELDRDISRIFCFADLGFKKDSLHFWQAVEDGLGVPMRRIAMVGDSLEQDALAPRAFGVQGVWLSPGETSGDGGVPVPRVSSLLEFAHWVLNAG